MTTNTPHNREAEEAVLGSVLINSDIYLDLSQILRADDFYIHRNVWIWRAFESLTSQGQPIDIITVTDELSKSNKLQEFGGSAYLTSLLNATATSLNAEAYAEKVKDYSRRRVGIAVANEIATAAYKGSDVFDLSIFAQRMMMSSEQSTRKTGKDVIGEIYSELYEPKSPMTFGISDLDDRLGGMFRSELTIIAGDQGTGKSALMIWMARENAKHKKRVLGVSLEMKAKSWYMRMACGDLGVNWNQVRAGKVSEKVRNEVWEKALELEELYRDSFVVYEDPMTLQNIQAAATREMADIVFIDHVGLISGLRETRGVEKIDQLNSITRFLRQSISKPNDCHVVLLWQLNRSAFKENRKPTKHDLFMAGTQDPDLILLLYRPDLYDEEKQKNIPTHPVDVDFIIGKARNDFTGEIPIEYNLQKQSFAGLARKAG